MMSAVAANLALCLPVKSLTDRDMSLILAGIGIEAPESFDPADRRFSGEVSIWWPGWWTLYLTGGPYLTSMPKRAIRNSICSCAAAGKFWPADMLRGSAQHSRFTCRNCTHSRV